MPPPAVGARAPISAPRISTVPSFPRTTVTVRVNSGTSSRVTQPSTTRVVTVQPARQPAAGYRYSDPIVIGPHVYYYEWTDYHPYPVWIYNPGYYIEHRVQADEIEQQDISPLTALGIVLLIVLLVLVPVWWMDRRL